MKIYRVEHITDGYGPYAWKHGRHGHGGDPKEDNFVQNPLLWPGPLDRLEKGTPLNRRWKKGNTKNIIFGFRSLESLKRWFCDRDNVRKLCDKNFVIAVYNSDNYFEGCRQIAFTDRELETIMRLDIIL